MVYLSAQVLPRRVASDENLSLSLTQQLGMEWKPQWLWKGLGMLGFQFQQLAILGEKNDCHMIVHENAVGLRVPYSQTLYSNKPTYRGHSWRMGNQTSTLNRKGWKGHGRMY